ncbi:cytochrome P450 [Cryptosporangium aurantiacum]|uniref:Cytochrome P450 n=1 Tax=Cryptosporangium aurantiacum TaxID=134849 RepID=A0A1M7PJY8_9ACTN|nr:cytochrome P450 [Cryptosporangium aurantiacum]SHN17444.1 Cytochrome P450 [Cryptosporangium aurantiacum]
MTTVSFDHHSPEYAHGWREINADLRGRCPVARTDAHGGFWVISKYDDVAAVARDDATFSSYQELPDGSRTGATIPVAPLRQVPIEMDPPEFFAYRKLLNPSFSPASVKAWEPFVRDVTTFCLDRVIAAGTTDLIRDIASPVPAILTLRVLGLPTEDWQVFSDTTHDLVHTVPGTPENDTALAGMFALIGQITQTIVERRAAPADDLISHLVRSEIDGRPLTDERLMEVITLVILGGVDTTGSLIGNALHWLQHHPEQRERLRVDPSLLPAATEEFLRFFSPVPGLARTATTDCVIGGQTIAAGDRLFLSWSSANHDEDAFDAPGEVRLDRTPNRHQSFGLGIHRCLGSNVARLEFRVVLEEVLRRLPDYVIDVEAATPYSSIGVVNGWVSLPATFTPAAPQGSDFSSERTSDHR